MKKKSICTSWLNPSLTCVNETFRVLDGCPDLAQISHAVDTVFIAVSSVLSRIPASLQMFFISSTGACVYRCIRFARVFIARRWFEWELVSSILDNLTVLGLGTMSTLNLWSHSSWFMYVGRIRASLSSGLSMMILRYAPRLIVSAYCLTSRPMMRGLSPSVRSNVSDNGLNASSLTVKVHEHITGLAFTPFGPHPCRYCFRGGSRLSRIPRRSQIRVAVAISPVHVGAPSSKIGFGSGWGSPILPTENTALYSASYLHLWQSLHSLHLSASY